MPFWLKRWLRGWRPLRAWLSGSIMLALLLALGVYGVYWQERQYSVRLAAETVRTYEALTQHLLAELDHAVTGAAAWFLALPPGEARDLVTPILLQRKQTQPLVMDYLILNQQGEIVAWTGAGVVPNVSQRGYFQHHRDNPESSVWVTRPQLSLVHTDRWFFSVSRALRDQQGDLHAIAVAVIDLAVLESVFNDLRGEVTLALALLRQDGELIVRVPPMGVVPEARLLRAIQEDPFTAAIKVHLPEVESLLGWLSQRPLPEYDLVLVGAFCPGSELKGWQWTALGFGLLWLTITLLGYRWAVWAASVRQRLRRPRLYDPLTELPNRALLRELIQQSLRVVRRVRGRSACLFIDLDGFTALNDRYGVIVGDQILTETARRVRNALREADIVGRYGADEFLVLLHAISQPEDGLQVAEMLRETLHEPYVLADGMLNVSCRIGVALCPEHGAQQRELLDLAILAMRQARTQEVPIVVYQPPEPAE